jgi:glyoxylase-like metal-dependent hydrolase (beta-lactamase superfamily II)
MSGLYNVFVLSQQTTTLMFDTARRRSRTALFRRLDGMGVRRLDALVLSHTHFDHVENAAAIRERYQARVIVHASEAADLRSGNTPLPAGTILPTRILTSVLAKRLQPRFAYDPCHSDVGVEDRLGLQPFGIDGYLTHTPGHSRGSLSLVVGDELALVGDTLYGVWPGTVLPPFGDEVGRLIESWGKLLETPCRVYLPGHGRPIARALLENCYRRRGRT